MFTHCSSEDRNNENGLRVLSAFLQSKNMIHPEFWECPVRGKILVEI